jgi:hypothetical protein
MDIKHVFGLSRFRGSGESHVQDGERLTRACSRLASASSDPAMAFWPFRLMDGAIIRAVPDCGSILAAG